MLAKVNSFILLGIDAQLCEVEVDASQHGMEKTVVVGLAQAAVKESLERVARAIINCGYPFLARHLLVNLAPADVKKEATALDLPIAVGIMRATACINTDRHREFLIAGELALDDPGHKHRQRQGAPNGWKAPQVADYKRDDQHESN